MALAAALVLGAVVAFTRIGSNPIAFAASTWWELRDEVVEVEHVRASTVAGGAPAQATADAASAVDRNLSTAWSVPWTAPARGTPCDQLATGGSLQLELPPTRVRKLRVVSGVVDPSKRSLQLLPKTLFVSTSAGRCTAVALDRTDAAQVLDLDSTDPTGQVTIGVAETFEPNDPRATHVVSLTEVSLWARP